MSHPYRSKLAALAFVAACVLVLSRAGPLLAADAGPGIVDNAGLFSPSALQQAQAVAQQIGQQYGYDVRVETFAQIPPELGSSYDPQQRDQFYANWARQRARASGIGGVYVLITRDPAHLFVDVGNQTRQRAFTLQDRNRLREILVSNFRQGNYDAGLVQGLGYVRTAMANNLAAAGRSGQAEPAGGRLAPGQRPGGISWTTVLILVLIGAAILWIISRAMVSRRSTYPPYPPSEPGSGGESGAHGYGSTGYGPGGPYGGYGGGMGGGGMGRGLLGGLLGGAAGSWLYNRFFGGGGFGGMGGAGQVPPEQGGAPGGPPAGDFGPDVSQQDLSGNADFGGPPNDTGDMGGGGAGGGGDFGGGGDSGGGGDYA